MRNNVYQGLLNLELSVNAILYISFMYYVFEALKYKKGQTLRLQED